MSPPIATDLVAGLTSTLEEHASQVDPARRRQYELDAWRVLRETAERRERELRREELLAPANESSFKQTMWWMCEQGQEEELHLIRKVRQAPPFSAPDVLDLLARAELRICQRMGMPSPAEVQMLPEEVRRRAATYTMVRLGDALMTDGVGTLSVEDGVPTWHVKVRLQVDRELRGELRLSEDGRHVAWTRVSRGGG